MNKKKMSAYMHRMIILVDPFWDFNIPSNKYLLIINLDVKIG